MIGRLARLTLTARRRPRVSVWDTVESRYRVRVRDLDALRHMNNSVYLAALDLGRMDLVLRSGVWDSCKQHGTYAVVANQSITYRKSLKLGMTYRIETRVAGVDEKAAYFEQRFTVDGEIYAEAVVRMRFLRRVGGPVPMAEVLSWGEPLPVERSMPAWMKDWAASTALPSTREPALSTWVG